MYRKPTYEEDKSFQLKIPWDKNTARGFVGAVVFSLLFLIVSPIIHLQAPAMRETQYNTIPIEILNFGEGDGTGRSKGNLTEEGIAKKGQAPSSFLEDAQTASKTKVSKNPAQTDLLSDNMKAVNELSSDTKKNGDSIRGSGTKDIGSKDGLTDGSGLGSRGTGKGLGTGFGDIEWGGGGNRVVLHKPLPRFPSGVNTNASLKFKFTVLADGTVGRIIPLQKADPRLEQAGLEALRQWRFNPVKQGVIMEGIIPLTFVLK